MRFIRDQPPPPNQMTATRRQGDVILGQADVRTKSVLGRYKVVLLS